MAAARGASAFLPPLLLESIRLADLVMLHTIAAFEKRPAA